MPIERKVWAAVTLLIATATAFYMGVVVGAHTMVGKRVVLQQVVPAVVGPHENDGYGIDR